MKWSQRHARGRAGGFTLLETMMALVIGVAVCGLLLESVLFLYKQALWLSCHQSAQVEADALRWLLARDLYFADEIKVEDRDGTRLTISGPVNAAGSSQDEIQSGSNIYVDNTNRFSIKYIYTPPDSGSGPGTLVRSGPGFQEVDSGIPIMLQPDQVMGTKLASMLQAQDGKPVFQLLGRGRVKVGLRVQQNLKGMFWGAPPDPSYAVSTVDINLTAIAQRVN